LAGAKALKEEFSAEISSGLIAQPAIEHNLRSSRCGEQMKRRTGIAAGFFPPWRNGVNVVAIAQALRIEYFHRHQERGRKKALT
jgi:hypothetical protein